MYELDYMLDGEASRQRHQDIIKEVQQENYARRIANLQRTAAQKNRGLLSQLRAVFTAITHAIIG